MLRAFVVTALIGGIAVGACLAALVPGVTTLWNGNAYTTPAVSNLRKLDQRSTVYDAAGNQIGVLGLVDREAVPLAAVPRTLINAVVATEDRTFWHNDGIDLASVFRAALKDFTSGKDYPPGNIINPEPGVGALAH